MMFNGEQNETPQALDGLEGKVAIVTGGGTGLGRSIALSLAAYGTNVIIAGRRATTLREVELASLALPGKISLYQADISDPSQVKQLIEYTLQQYSVIDVLFNNAGLIGEIHGVPLWEMSDELWQKAVNVNLSGPFYCARTVSRHMVNRGMGKISNVSSVYGLRGGKDNFAYTITKGGVIQLTRSLAVSLGRYGITSNCIVPGFIPTEGTHDVRSGMPNTKFIPLNRAGTPDEIGQLGCFLASSNSDYITGELFPIDGGSLAGGFAPTGYNPGGHT